MGWLVLNVSGLVADDSISVVQGASRDTSARAVVGFACGVSDVLAGKLEADSAFKASDSTMEFPDNNVCEVSNGSIEEEGVAGTCCVFDGLGRSARSN
jgi:hypothetical protein